MPFPNFYVPSVREKIARKSERSRMSLSHPEGCEHIFRYFHFRFILQSFTQHDQTASAAPFREVRSRRRFSFSSSALKQLSPAGRV